MHRDATHMGKETGQIIGVFLQGGYEIVKGLGFEVGSRYDNYLYFDKNSQNHHTWGFSPSGFLLYEPFLNLDIKLGYGYIVSGALPGDTFLLYQPDFTI